MLKKSKIIAMTKLAIYEKHKGEEALEITRYYREDYISNRILQGIIRYTAVFFLLSLMYLLMQGEDLLMKMSFPFLISLGRRAVLFYLLGLTFFVAVFLFFSYFSYEKAVEVRKQYEQSLEERLEFTPLYGRDRQERGSKEGIAIERAPKESQVKNGKETSSKKALQKIDLEKRTGNENWLDEEDWLDE